MFNELKGQEFIFWMVAALGSCHSRPTRKGVRTAEERYYYETRLELARDAAGEDVRGPMAQHGQQLPWPDTC